MLMPKTITAKKHEMAHQGKPEIARILLESGASLNHRDKKGNNAMESSLESQTAGISFRAFYQLETLPLGLEMLISKLIFP